MFIHVKSFGLLEELINKKVPREMSFEKRSPVTFREILEEYGVNIEDFGSIAVSANNIFIREKDFDTLIEAETVQVCIYPIFSGG